MGNFPAARSAALREVALREVALRGVALRGGGAPWGWRSVGSRAHWQDAMGS
ncbi:hypothetical protein LBMAG53_00270 [Planctomycetota bacterium]|nr:hypothetical protein LBMAG53_00270 [Planctomycetota bacterium]